MAKIEYEALLAHGGVVNELSHSSVKGMKWDYNHGTRNGKRTAEEDDDKLVDEIAWGDMEEARKYLAKAKAKARELDPTYEIIACGDGSGTWTFYETVNGKTTKVVKQFKTRDVREARRYAYCMAKNSALRKKPERKSMRGWKPIRSGLLIIRSRETK